MEISFTDAALLPASCLSVEKWRNGNDLDLLQ